MKAFMLTCRLATEDATLSRFSARYYFLETERMYSMRDLVQLSAGTLLPELQAMHRAFERHVKTCPLCTARGFYCEVCNDKHIIFPFEETTVRCPKCAVCFHKRCWNPETDDCPKCLRVDAYKKSRGAGPEGGARGLPKERP